MSEHQNEYDATRGEDDLLLYVCGELDEADRRRVEASIAADPSLAAEAQRLRAAADAVAPAGAEAVPGRFNDHLRVALLTDAPRSNGDRPAAATVRRPLRFLPRVSSLAAAVLLGFIAGALVLLSSSPRGPLSASVAWADVVKATSQAEQIHIALMVREGDREYVLDLFYRRPDTWRAQGAGLVHFASAAGEKVFNIGERRFVDPGRSPVSPLPPQEIRKHLTEGNLLDGIVKAMFNGQSIPGEPVRAAAESLQGDAEVFDYFAQGEGWSGDAAPMRARIWVLRNSRLPMRLEMRHRDETIQASFSYSDPQPAAFFDADAFAKTVSEKDLRGAAAIYHVGEAEPTAPTRAATAPATSSDATTRPLNKPTVAEIIATPTGEVVLTLTGTMNGRGRDAENRVISEAFGTLADTWGNLYTQCGMWAFGNDGRYHNRLMLVPIGEFQRGEGERRLRTRYLVRVQRIIPVGGGNAFGTFDDVVAGEYDVAIPAPAAADDAQLAMVARDFPDADRRAAVRSHLLKRLPLAAQLPIIDRWIADEPESVDAVLTKMDRLSKMHREDQAYKLLESTVLDAVLNEAPGQYDRGRVMGEYLFYLARKGREAEIAPLVKRLEARRQAVLDEGRPADLVASPTAEQYRARSAARWVQINDDYRHNPLPAAMELPATFVKIAAGPGPTLVRAVASRDGFLAVELNMPQYAGDQLNWSVHADAPRGWVLIDIAAPAQAATQPTGSRMQPRVLIFERVTPAGDESDAAAPLPASLELPFSVTLPRNRRGTVESYELSWSLKIALPAASVATLREWTATSAPAADWTKASNNPSVMEYLAERRFALGRADAALEMCDRALAIPYEVWPANLKNPANFGEGQDLSLQLQTLRARCLARLGRIADADAALDAAQKTLPAPYRPERLRDAAHYTAVRFARLFVVRCLIERGDFAEAQRRLAAVEADRPELMTLDNLYVTEMYPNKRVISTDLFDAVRDQWAETDATWLDLRDAMRGEIKK